MKIKTIDIPAAGTWARDCELISLIYHNEFKLNYHKDEDDTYWSIKVHGMIAYKVFSEEFYMRGYLMDLPVEGAFYEISDSPWVSEFRDYKAEVIEKCKHYVFQFYDEVVEVIAQECSFEKSNEKPKIIFD